MLKWVVARMPLHLTLIGLMLLWSIPTLALLISSFRESADIASSGWWTVIKQPFAFTLDNYEAVLSQRGMARSFLNSLIITVPSTLLVILVAAFTAYAFAWMKFPGRNALFLIVVALLVVPVQMTIIPVLQLYVNLNDNLTFLNNGLPLLGGRLFGVNSFPGMWVAHTAYGLPFAVFLLRNFFGALPRDLFESAYLDGASDLGVFFRLVLPLSLPAIAALAIFQFLWVWNDLLLALILMGDPSVRPMTVQIQSLVSSFGTNYQVLTAAAFVSMILPLAVFFALQRYFVQGILAGSVKG
ncbi:MAG: carbohydrate ABC transporter permease [Chloroflexi bacterium]|nr:carbohydrate ABC transporter permease [Chloroflexota bacterium]